MPAPERSHGNRWLPVAFTLVLSSMPALAAGEEAAPSGLHKDAAAYAEQYGVSVDEARNRLELQSVAGELDAQLELGRHPWYAGLRIEHEPDWKVVVYSTQPDLPEFRSIIASSPIAGRTVAAPARYSLASLDSLQQRIAEGTDPGAVWSLIDVSTNSVVVHADAESWDDFVNRESVPLPMDALTINRQFRGPEHSALFGGQTLTRASGTEACTSGFAVTSSNGGGVVTAGHCWDDLYKGGNSIPFVDEAWFGSHDEQYNRKNGLVIENKIKDDNSGGTRQITGKVGRSNQSVGSFVCKYGFASGYTCGIIYSKTGWPSANTPNPDNTFIIVEPATQDSTPDDLNDHGDSGGPVFVGNNAWGIVHGCIEYPSNTIYDCDYAFNTDWMVYTAINYVENGLDVTVLTN